MYTIRLNIAMEDMEFTGTLEDAKRCADECAAYTETDIKIFDEDGVLVACREWWGVPYDPEVDDSKSPICFGDYGYYSDWNEDADVLERLS